MRRIIINKIVVDKNKFQHFLEGDGEYWWDDEYGALITEEEGMKYLKELDDEYPNVEDTGDLMREAHFYDSYESLKADYDYYYEDGEIDYIEVGDKVVLIIARLD